MLSLCLGCHTCLLLGVFYNGSSIRGHEYRRIDRAVIDAAHIVVYDFRSNLQDRERTAEPLQAKVIGPTSGRRAVSLSYRDFDATYARASIVQHTGTPQRSSITTGKMHAEADLMYKT